MRSVVGCIAAILVLSATAQAEPTSRPQHFVSARRPAALLRSIVGAPRVGLAVTRARLASTMQPRARRTQAYRTSLNKGLNRVRSKMRKLDSRQNVTSDLRVGLMMVRYRLLQRAEANLLKELGRL